MNSFYETYECKIDDKGRVKLPSSLIKHLDYTAGKPLVVKRSVFQKCLEIYPMTEWDILMTNIGKLNRFDKKKADFVRMFTAGVKVIEIDSAERILIPKDLKSFATLEKEIVLSGAGPLIEIWDKNAYESLISTTEENFAALTEEVMGSFDDENM